MLNETEERLSPQAGTHVADSSDPDLTAVKASAPGGAELCCRESLNWRKSKSRRSLRLHVRMVHWALSLWILIQELAAQEKLLTQFKV